MGVFLRFKLSPYRITEKQWENVYKEALQIVKHCDFLDCVTEDHGGRPWRFAQKTEERETNWGGPGIFICGTMSSGRNTEEFSLLRNLEFYRASQHTEDKGADILFSDWYPEDPEIPYPTHVTTVWDDKTQGKPAHIPLLAIACLFADRFPEAVKVGGDITVGQCRSAVQLANQYLDRPIQTPVTCRAEALAERLKRSGIPESKWPETFFRLYLGTLTPEVGNILKTAFSTEILYRYFRDELSHLETEDSCFQIALRDYLLLGFDLSDLLKILVSDPDGEHMTLEDTLSTLFYYRIHVPFEEKNCYDPLALDAAVAGNEDAPHGIDALLGRAFFRMTAGPNRNIPVYLPIETIRDACRAFSQDADALIDRLLTEQVTDERQEAFYGNDENSIVNKIGKLAEQLQAENEERQEYDIGRFEDIYHYRPGCTIHPGTEKVLMEMVRKIQGFDIEKDYQDFLSLDRAGREGLFIRANQYVLIRKEVWNHIFSHIMDDDYVRRYFWLFRVNCQYQRVFDVMEPFINSPDLVDELWEKVSAQTWTVGSQTSGQIE